MQGGYQVKINPMITNRKWEEMAFITFKSPSISQIPNLYFFLFYLGGSTSVSAQHSNSALNIQSITSNALELQ